MTLLAQIQQQCSQALQQLYPDYLAQLPISSVEITPATNSKFGHYQCNSAMKLAKILGKAPKMIADQMRDHLLNSPAAGGVSFANIEVAGPGFINFTLSNQYLEQTLNQQIHDPKHGCDVKQNNTRVVIDFSSPNIAKEMHVGHLRSTIIGDCIARVLEFTNHKVLRLNHVGDWGTQFGMLIAYLTQQNLDLAKIQQLTLTDLVTAYKASKVEFDNDPQFKQKAQLAVVALQQGDAASQQIWQAICAISRTAFEQVYKILDIKLLERGESFYNPYLPKIIADLEQKNLITVSDGAKCIFLDGFTNREGEPLPLMVQKSDGGYNYATTDLAALNHRVKDEQANWIIYVTDAGQSQHFAMVFAASRLAHYYDPAKVRVDHVPFGLVLRADGKKFKTRSGDTARLIDLLEDAVDAARDILVQRNYTDVSGDELEQMAQTLGINAIKYADLANNRVSDYSFSLERMLQFEGNTAAFLCYAYVRIQSIKRKVAQNIDAMLKHETISLQTAEEIDLGLKLLQFSEVIQNFQQDLLPSRLAEYLFHVAEKFHTFFHNCRVEGVPEQNSRLLLCEATSRVLAQGLELLGLKPLNKM